MLSRTVSAPPFLDPPGYARHWPESTLLYQLVAFSCKKRGFCPSSGARRMAETAALLADEVLPERRFDTPSAPNVPWLKTRQRGATKWT